MITVYRMSFAEKRRYKYVYNDWISVFILNINNVYSSEPKVDLLHIF